MIGSYGGCVGWWQREGELCACLLPTCLFWSPDEVDIAVYVKVEVSPKQDLNARPTRYHIALCSKTQEKHHHHLTCQLYTATLI